MRPIAASMREVSSGDNALAMPGFERVRLATDTIKSTPSVRRLADSDYIILIGRSQPLLIAPALLAPSGSRHTHAKRLRGDRVAARHLPGATPRGVRFRGCDRARPVP